MLTTWIIEDNPSDQKRLEQLIKERAQKENLPVQIRCFSEAAQLEKEAMTADLVFMDIELGKDSGIDLAQKLKADNPSAVIVLMSSFPHYSIEGYKTGAIRFLLKPVQPDAFNEALPSSLLQKMARQTWLQVDEISDHPLPFSRILYIESQDRQSIIHTPSRTYPTSIPLKQYAVMLQGGDFVQCYKSILVNLARVERMEESRRDLLLKNGELIPVSRHYRKDTENALRRYIWTTF